MSIMSNVGFNCGFILCLALVIVDMKEDKNVISKRCALIEQVADFDSDLANKIIETESLELVSKDDLYKALKRVTWSTQAVPVLVGSSYKNIGVQPLLDSILRYYLVV